MTDRRRRHWGARARRRVGRRGAFLLAFGAVYMLLGVGLLGRELDPHEADTYRWTLAVMPFAGWGAAAMLAGWLAWVGAVARRWHIDAAAFAALQTVAVGWSLCMAAAAVAGDGAAARGGFTWATIAVALGIVSGWPEPPR